MAKIRVTNYSNTKEILKYDHFVSILASIPKSAGTSVEGKTIVKAGTILPSNDDKAVGVLLYDVDVTNGDESGSIVVHGFIDKTKIPTAPDAKAITALPMIKFI